MQFPKPIGYYSIDLPDMVVSEIEALSLDQLKDLLCDISLKIAEHDELFDNNGLATIVNHTINSQLSTTNDWLGFMQWTLERLKQAHN